MLIGYSRFFIINSTGLPNAIKLPLWMLDLEANRVMSVFASIYFINAIFFKIQLYLMFRNIFV